MRLTTKAKPVDALGQPLDQVELYKPVQAFSASIDGAPTTFTEAVRVPGNHPAVVGHAALWIKSSTDSSTAARLKNAAIYGQPAPQHEPLTHEPKPIPTSRQMIVTRDFIAGAGANLVRLAEGDVVDKQNRYFADLVKAYPQNFRRAGETEAA